MKTEPAPYTKQKKNRRGSNSEVKRTIEKRTKTNNRIQRGSNKKQWKQSLIYRQQGNTPRKHHRQQWKSRANPSIGPNVFAICLACISLFCPWCCLVFIVLAIVLASCSLFCLWFWFRFSLCCLLCELVFIGLSFFSLGLQLFCYCFGLFLLDSSMVLALFSLFCLWFWLGFPLRCLLV